MRSPARAISLLLIGGLIGGSGSTANAVTQVERHKGPHTETDAQHDPQSRWAPLADEVGRLLAATPNPQATLIIVDDGAIGLQRDYTVDTRQQAATRQSGGSGTTPFRLGSITKTFTALALLHAAAATNTALDTPLVQIIDKSLWSNPWRETHPVRLGQLIELSAGFADISGDEFNSAKPLPRLQALALDANSHVTHWPPGLQHSYTNLAPAYSALALEALTGQSFESYLARHVLKPLGMPGATLQPLPTLPGGFKADGRTPIPYWHTIYPAFGGLNVQPVEFANFLIRLALHDFGDELDSALQKRGTAPIWQPTTTAAARAGLVLGYGAGIYASLRAGHIIYGHGGDADGYRSRYGVVQDKARGYFIAINSDNPQLLRGLQATIERALVADLPRSTPAAAQSEGNLQAQLQRVAGEYYPASKRFGISRWKGGNSEKAQIVVANNRLQMHRGDRSTELLWLGNNLVRRPQDPAATAVFVNARGNLYLQGELGNWRRIKPIPERPSRRGSAEAY